MNKKALICASRASHIENFHVEYINYLKLNGYEIHTIAQGIPNIKNIDKTYDIKFKKNIFSISNLVCIIKISRVLKNENYKVISTQATLAGILCRLSAKLVRAKSFLVHICHGYLFNDNNSIKSKIFITIEKMLSCVTNLLITMNNEDYNIAKKHKLCKNIEYINGMGINPKNFAPINEQEIEQFRDKYNIKENYKTILCVGEFSKRKNQAFIINSFAKLIKKLPNTYLIFAGDGTCLNKCKKLAYKLKINKNIIFLGQVKDTNILYRNATIVVSASKFEGLPFNIMEALLCNVPVICSNIKGHIDLIQHNKNGLLFNLENNDELTSYMYDILNGLSLYNNIKINCNLNVKFYLENVLQNLIYLINIYTS